MRVKSKVRLTREIAEASWPRAVFASLPWLSRTRNAGCRASIPLSTIAQQIRLQRMLNRRIAASALIEGIERSIARLAGRFKLIRKICGLSLTSGGRSSANARTCPSKSQAMDWKFFRCSWSFS